jgi:DNA-binding CsgD family transcriptional regulator
MSGSGLSSQTRREREILDEMARGLSCRGIACALAISELTVKTHCRNMLAKLGLRNADQLLEHARQEQYLLRPPELQAASILSGREREVMLLVIQGFTSKEISQRLGISDLTVRKHRENLLRKLGPAQHRATRRERPLSGSDARIDESPYSASAVMKDVLGARARSYKGQDNPVNILSLGDMTPQTGDDAVRTVLRERGFGPGRRLIKSVKLSHHGSESNLLPVLDDVVSQECTVLISGYTMTALDSLLSKLKQWQPKKTYMLFDARGEQEIQGQLDPGTEGGKALKAANVEMLTDFHVPLS